MLGVGPANHIFPMETNARIALGKAMLGVGQAKNFLSLETNTSIAFLGKQCWCSSQEKKKIVCLTAPSIALPEAALVFMLGAKVFLAAGQKS